MVGGAMMRTVADKTFGGGGGGEGVGKSGVRFVLM